MRRWSSAAVSSPMELCSLGRVYGRRSVVQAASPPSPRGQWIQGNDECRYCLGTNSVTGVARLVLSCQTTFGAPAPDFLLGFTPLALPRTGRPQGSNGVMSYNIKIYSPTITNRCYTREIALEISQASILHEHAGVR